MTAPLLGAARPRLLHAVLTAGAALTVLSALTACMPMPPPLAPLDSEHLEDSMEHWEQIDPAMADDQQVIITFTELPEDPDDPRWEELYELELTAGEALLDAGVGYLDGNGSDGAVYDVYFYGEEHEAMWRILEPLYAEAPIPWSHVHIWESWEDEEPTILTQ